jgi:hypothetical protein
MLMDEVRGELVLKRLPQRVLESFTPDQVAAIRRAGGAVAPRRHPIDARYSFRLPLFGHSYAVLLFGRELRSPQRRTADKRLRAIDRIGQVVLLLLGASALLLAALIGVLVENAIVAG